MPLSTEKEFIYTFSSKDLKSTLRVPVVIPQEQDARDLTGRLVFEHNLPCYIEDGIMYINKNFSAYHVNNLFYLLSLDIYKLTI